MIVKDNPAALDEKIRRARDYLSSLHPREDGIHVSDLISCRRRSWYKRQRGMDGKPLFSEPPHSTNTELMFLLGQGHHAILQQDRDERKAVAIIGGHKVTGSIDDWVDDSEKGYPEEYKTTRASLAKSPIPAIHYIEQGGSYAVMEGVNKLRVTVFYLFGDWKAAKFPQGRSTDIQFSDVELVEWYSELTHRVNLITGPTPPGFEHKRNWECDYCPFSQAKGGPCEAVKTPKGQERPEFFVVEDSLAQGLEEDY